MILRKYKEMNYISVKNVFFTELTQKWENYQI